MNAEQKQAYEWAKSQNYQSVAARYAKELATLVDSLQAQLTEASKWASYWESAWETQCRENKLLHERLAELQLEMARPTGVREGD